jgi:hypothetical protein
MNIYLIGLELCIFRVEMIEIIIEFSILGLANGVGIERQVESE